MIIFVINNNHVTNFNYIALKAPGSDVFTHRVGCKSAKNSKQIYCFAFLEIPYRYQHDFQSFDNLPCLKTIKVFAVAQCVERKKESSCRHFKLGRKNFAVQIWRRLSPM